MGFSEEKQTIFLGWTFKIRSTHT